MSGYDSNGITVLTAPATGDSSVVTEGPVFEMVSAAHFFGAAFHEMAVGVDSPVIEFDGDVFRTYGAQMNSCPNADLRADGQFSAIISFNLFNANAVPVG